MSFSKAPILPKKFGKLRFSFFRPLHIKQAKKNGHTAFENCVADLLLDAFHAVGGHIKMISEVRRSPPMRNSGSSDSIARVVSEGFCSKLRFGNRRNPLRISRFSNRSVGAKTPLSAAAEVVFIGRLPPGRVRRRREQLRLRVIGIGRRAAVGVRFMAAGSYRCDVSAVQIVPEACVGVPADVFPFEPRSLLLIDIPPDMPSP